MDESGDSDEAVEPTSAPAPRTRRVAALIGLDTAVRATIGFFVGLIVARYLGPASYGTLAIAITVVTILVPVGGLGTDAILIQRVAEYGPSSQQAQALLRATSGVRAGGAALTAVVALSFAAFRTPEEALAVLAAAPALLAGPFEAGWGWVMATGHVGRLVGVRILITIVAATARLTIVATGGGVPALALVTGLEVLTLAIAASLVARHQGARLAPASSSRRALLKESLPVMLSALFFLLMLRLDTLMVGVFLGDTETGRYAAVVRFAEATYLVASVAVAAAAPRIIAAHRAGSAGYVDEYRRLLRGLVAVATALALALSIGAVPLMGTLLGDAYLPAAPVLAVYAWSALPVYVGAARDRLVIDLTLTRTTVFNTMGGLVINVVLNLILLPTIGIMGAGIATVVSYAAIVTVLPAIDRRQRPVNRVLVSSLVPSTLGRGGGR